MKTRPFRITIAASRAAVWHVLLHDAMFRQWVPSLAEGSCADGDWSEDGVIRFLTARGDGMVSVVTENRRKFVGSSKTILQLHFDQLASAR